MHRLTIAIAALTLLLVACSSTDRASDADSAATTVVTPPAAPSVEPTPTAPPPAPLPSTEPPPVPTYVAPPFRLVLPDRRFVLDHGETVLIVGATATLTFEEVVQDSRCPTDVTCIRAGDVMLRLTTTGVGGPNEIELTIGDRGDPAASFDGLTVTLLEVAPIPRSPGAIDPLSYSATLTVAVSAP